MPWQSFRLLWHSIHTSFVVGFRSSRSLCQTSICSRLNQDTSITSDAIARSCVRNARRFKDTPFHTRVKGVFRCILSSRPLCGTSPIKSSIGRGATNRYIGHSRDARKFELASSTIPPSKSSDPNSIRCNPKIGILLSVAEHAFSRSCC